MALGWLTVLKAVPWTDVIANAPKVADGAKKLWRTVSKSSPQPEAPAAGPMATTEPGGVPWVALEGRLQAAEATIAALHSQMLASAEIISALTEQNTQLISRVEANRVRTGWLAVATLVAVLVALASIVISVTAQGK
jgi:hypothetical protein